MTRRYVSLFSGAGGLDIGLERAGFEAISMCEIERLFCSTLERNKGWVHCDGHTYFEGTQIINADIREVSANDLHAGGDLDLVVGGPPCQAFSSSGKQLSVLDPRGALVSEFFRIVDSLKPKMFLFENVRGLVTARGNCGVPGAVITELIHFLEGAGYSCRAGLLNAADFGSYQRRVRCFILGSRRGEAPSFPTPSHAKDPGLFGTPWLTLAQFLEEFAECDESSYTYPSAALREQLLDLPDGSGIRSPGKPEATRPGGHWGYRQGTFIADLKTPARTVTGSASQDWVRWNGVLRRLTFSEVVLLQGFPSDWEFCGSKSDRFKQVGNAVPPLFGEILGRVISDHLVAFPDSEPVRLGLPKGFISYMDYTKRDHERNKESRSIHRRFQ